MQKNKLLVMFCFIAGIAVMGCKAKSETIKIGGIFPLSGSVAVYGLEARNGIALAIEEINEAGGILGKQVELVGEDDEGKPEITVNAFNKLTAKDKVNVIIGSLTSGCTLAITSKAQAQQVVLIAPAATSAPITDAGDYIFRACFTDSFQGTAGGNFAATELGAKTAAVLFNSNNDYSVSLKDNFIIAFQSSGGEIVGTESYSEGDVDFKAQLTKLGTKNPEVVYLPDYYSNVALISTHLREVGITAQLIGADGWDGITDKVGQGNDVVGGFYSNHYSADSSDSTVKNFVKNYKSRFGTTPVSFAALAYDSVYLLKDAMEKAGTADDTSAIKDALAATNGKYLTGDLSFDEKHNPVKPAVIVEIIRGSDGNLTTAYKATINP
ncbi:MAG: ABC transporter substrate-binding protein [Termitinemataceae bacterium]|nr:MAG: ABC transporter substrate-binding protein [Termitinemataceae bacterium]